MIIKRDPGVISKDMYDLQMRFVQHFEYLIRLINLDRLIEHRKMTIFIQGDLFLDAHIDDFSLQLNAAAIRMFSDAMNGNSSRKCLPITLG